MYDCNVHIITSSVVYWASPTQTRTPSWK